MGGEGDGDGRKYDLFYINALTHFSGKKLISWGKNNLAIKKTSVRAIGD